MTPTRTASAPADAAPSPALATNPLLCPWDTPHGMPPFADIRPEHFPPAFAAALAEHCREVAAIADDPAPPTFANTIVAFDRAGASLGRIARLFFNLAASATSPAMQAVEREVAPVLAAHHAKILLDATLFARVDALHRRRDELGLDPEALQLLDRMHLDFVFAGARLPAEARARIAAIDERMATLYTQFRQNLLADEGAFTLVLRDEQDLAGLPESFRTAARAEAQARGVADAWVVPLTRAMVVEFLTHADRRDLREQLFRAWARRGENDGDHDNRPVAREILALRHELARCHGYPSFAAFALVDRMAGTPDAVAQLLGRVWEPAKAKAAAEREALADAARAGGATHAIEPWDWRYYAEKVRTTRYACDDAEYKPFFALDRMQAAAFDCAHRLFGVRFHARPDLPAYHPDVRVYEVRDAHDRHVGLFLSDNFARPGKRSGAWMSVFRPQSRRDGRVTPIVVNNLNLTRPPEGQPTLLAFDELRTLFHEFGHGLHGLLSDVTYERLSGTRVLRDFVELPSQIFEHWALEPCVLQRHARHHETGAPIAEDALARLRAARLFNQGFETVEYTACALLDMALHEHPDPGGLDLTAFEDAELARIGMPAGLVLRHRLPHFAHIFGGSGYCAGYYVYMWAEVLDCDAFAAFTEAGDPFDPELAQRLLRYVYASGGTLDPKAAYRAFRGRDAVVEPMLADRGLI